MIKITREEMLVMLERYFGSEVESCPLNAEAFLDVLFHKYGV